MALRHGGKILADQLKIQGVRRVFSVPGESFLAALDGLHESGIENIVCRQEGGAAIMAEAHGKLTGAPGVVFVTRGPGAANASAGLHIAMQDSTPLVAFVGQINRSHRDRGAFQEVAYKEFFGSFVKWVVEVDQTERLPEYIARAFHLAQSGRPGPVVLALPEDMLSAMADVADRPAVVAPIQPVPMDLAKRMMSLLSRYERPLVIAGGAGWSQTAAQNLYSFASAHDLPVAVTFRRQDYLDNRTQHYVGDLGVGANPKLVKRLKAADFVLLLGAELRDIATDGYSHVDPADTGKVICQVHPDPDTLGQTYHADLGIAASGPEMLSTLVQLPPRVNPPWAGWRKEARADYEHWQEPHATPGAVQMEKIIPWLSETLSEDAILTNGAGNYAAFLHRYFRYRQAGTQLAPTSGSMGYGFPAAISAKLEHPDREVICLAGDGCFQMTCNEMSTTMQHDAAVIVIVVNNGKYGTIRMHQEKTYPGRVSGTALTNPDFAALSESYGGFGATVTRTEDFAAAFEQARASGKLSVIELVLDDEVLSTSQTVSQARASGEANGKASGAAPKTPLQSVPSPQSGTDA